MPVKTKAAERAEHAWIREFMPADHAALFLQGGPIDELMWLYQLNMGTRYQLIEGIIKPDLSLNTGPEIRRHFLDRYDQIVTILEESGALFVKLPELNLTAHFYNPGTIEPRFVDFEARVRIELYYFP